jgi:RNA polymerase sigma factor (sigma-70 family)
MSGLLVRSAIVRATLERMPFETDHSLLGKFVDAHERGDLEAAAEFWERLAINNYDRVVATVKAFRFSPGGPGLPNDELGSAVTEAFMRVIAMSAAFRKRETGRFYAALSTCVEHACLDFGRKELRHAKRAKGSLDQRYEPEGDAGPYDAALAAYDTDLRQQAQEALDAEGARQDAERLVAWGIAQITNDKHREVLELTYSEKLSGEAIAERLGISHDNVYQRRRRGILELERILREHPRP